MAPHAHNVAHGYVNLHLWPQHCHRSRQTTQTRETHHTRNILGINDDSWIHIRSEATSAYTRMFWKTERFSLHLQRKHPAGDSGYLCILTKPQKLLWTPTEVGHPRQVALMCNYSVTSNTGGKHCMRVYWELPLASDKMAKANENEAEFLLCITLRYKA